MKLSFQSVQAMYLILPQKGPQGVAKPVPVHFVDLVFQKAQIEAQLSVPLS